MTRPNQNAWRVFSAGYNRFIRLLTTHRFSYSNHCYIFAFVSLFKPIVLTVFCRISSQIQRVFN
ncbi:hypothetical protein Lalb_Chr02g0144241 [Lupinus albus]|uniref:Uncharacterized protein n=1 Tax=Lupinus albus TaxID=3870 RepID=A0A6A4QYZ8_LUPAL|nr:hypothetical protein Lalb_Chr02g0144241 [Lupinus albus]